MQDENEISSSLNEQCIVMSWYQQEPDRLNIFSISKFLQRLDEPVKQEIGGFFTKCTE